MQDWTKVVTEPLGLAGFALFLVFGVLSRLKAKEERRWFGPVASAMAVLALTGGLALAYVKTARETAQQTRPNPTQSNTNIQQTTTGAGSPVVQGVQGDVTITVDQSGVDQSGGTAVAKKPAAPAQGKPSLTEKPSPTEKPSQ
jgi:hypothetical protein